MNRYAMPPEPEMNRRPSPSSESAAVLPALQIAELRQLLRLTRSMVKHAEEQNWDEVARLDRDRLTLLDPARASHPDDTEKTHRQATAASLQAELLSADALVLQLAGQRRDQLAGEGSRLQAQHNARLNYARAQRLR